MILESCIFARAAEKGMMDGGSSLPSRGSYFVFLGFGLLRVGLASTELARALSFISRPEGRKTGGLAGNARGDILTAA